ncbi:porin [Hyphomicrobium sp. D-2]|uniref:porin n=1 Tax=Hyphomicrobium sp. D-2 TaxID=3041621 RepID=UPI002453ABCD|nr:porin [Hyphomicrobium sp. D-2]MDH4981679.1 porin [Hyphomicrobium sp. D-2]
MPVRKTALSAVASVVLGVGFTSVTVNAADLGGDCCADLEERVAELEATVARKGNRKVSLTISGYIAKQVMFWDDGAEQNAYVTDMGPTQASNIRFSGEVTIAAGWKAGYLMRIQDLDSNPMALSQTAPSAGTGLNVQMSYWYIASDTLGKISVGKNAMAAKSAAMFTDLSGTQVIANYVLFDGNAFFLRQNGQLSNLRWGDFGYCYSQQRPWGGDCDGIVMSGVRYDSPVFGGFSVSASWAEDDDWEIAGRYTGTAAGFKMAFGIGYSVNSDEQTQPPPVSFRKQSEFFQLGGYLQHLASGVFAHGIYGAENNNSETTFAGFTEPDTHQWYLKAGVRRQWLKQGHSVVFAEYGQYFDQLSPAALLAGTTSSEFTRWGFGVVQEIDAASMSLWVKYRQQSVDIDGGNLGDIEDFRYVSTGAIINF